MAVTRQRKLEVARRSYTLLTEKYGVPAEDILFDPLVFPCGTGDEKYVGSAEETVEGIRLIKNEFPESKTILGISNVSFGLPESGREVLNSVFLYHATKAGLDLAIVNTEKIVRYPSIPEEERRLSEDLIYNRGADPVAAFANYFKAKGAAPKAPKVRAGTPLERLPSYILEGSKEGLVDDLEAVRTGGMAPLDIINGPLMDGMREVGRLFNANELIVAEVLQSAEAMKAAVSHLEKFMEKSGGSRKGKVILATVKGDVHDIGKNLVEIILSNNGYEVDQPRDQGSAREARRSLRDARAGSDRPLGAAREERAADGDDRAGPDGRGRHGADARRRRGALPEIHGSPDRAGLRRARRLRRGRDARPRPRRPDSLERGGAERARRRGGEAAGSRQDGRPVRPGDPAFRAGRAEPRGRGRRGAARAAGGEERVLPELDLEEVWKYLNPHMLYAKHLGLRGSYRKLKEAGDPKLAELEQVIARVQNAGWIKARAMYRYFGATSEANTLSVLVPGGGEACFTFPRQVAGERLCLADFVHPHVNGATPPASDSVAFFITTAGEGVRAKAEELKNAGEYLLCHALQALAVETAEAAAEWLHAKLRAAWGFPDPPETTMLDRFQGRYRGKRYSFGYPACPDLGDQVTLFRLLDGNKIGVELTEGFMMDPEASVSALVLHHPQARYFADLRRPLSRNPFGSNGLNRSIPILKPLASNRRI